MDLDAIVSRLQVLPSFGISGVSATGQIEFSFNIEMGIVVQELLSQMDVMTQAQLIPAQITNWGRLAAQAKRIWEISEREYRIWRDTLYVELATPPEGGKKPTEKLIDSTIRKHPEYAFHYTRMETYEEVYNSCTAILDGWRAKKDMFKTGLIQQLENTAS